MGRNNKNPIIITFVIVAVALAVATATMEDDEKDCADQLANLAACIPFVSGGAAKPTTECCESTEKVRAAKPKCLCVLIKESADSSMGLPVNTTLALEMPSACKSTAKVSDCPSILGISPDSPDAKIFKAAGVVDSSTSPAIDSPASPSTTSSSAASTGSNSKAATATSSNGSAEFGGRVVSLVMCFASIAWLFI